MIFFSILHLGSIVILLFIIIYLIFDKFSYKNEFIKLNASPVAFVKDVSWKLGDTLIQKELANTLKRIRDNGQKGFYAGETARFIVEEMQKNSQNTYLEDFFIAFDNIKGDSKLASPDIFANRTLSEEITFNMSDEEVRSILEKKIDESIYI